ncbi:MAG TPA: creatininase family protein [Firmicutes bacterium]|nr:creatininase family protein [Bacillota bacterium]
MRTNKLAKLTWQEAAEAFKAKPVVLIPLGAVEPHGPQLPLGTDYMVAEHLALAAARETGSLVTPPIPFGYCDTVENIPGTMSVSPATLTALLDDVVRNLVKHGVEKIVFVNNHRSNAVALNFLCRRLRDELPVEFATFFPWGVILTICPPLYEDFQAVFGHGGEPETSVISYLFPEHLRMDLAKKDQYGDVWGKTSNGPSTLNFDGIPIEIYLRAEDVTETGTKGDPFAGSAERGEKIIKQATQHLTDFIKFFKDVPLKGDRS